MKPANLLFPLVLLACLHCVMPAHGDVVVVANQGSAAVSFVVQPREGKPQKHRVAAGGVLAIPSVGPLRIGYFDAGQAVRYALAANRAFRFDVASDGRIVFEQLRLGGNADTAAGTGLATIKTLSAVGVVPVKLLVDEDEPAARGAWERRLRARLAEASALFEQVARIRFQVVEIETWRSDDTLVEFADSIEEFRREAALGTARLVIGFTSQHAASPLAEMSSTPAPLDTHILIRERSTQLTESEKLEGLIHALGHFLGAVDADDHRAVMRRRLGDGQVRRAGYTIQFDPANLLALNLFAAELRLRGADNIASLSQPTLLRYRQIFPGTLNASDDPLADSAGEQGDDSDKTEAAAPNDATDESPPRAKASHGNVSGSFNDRMRRQLAGKWEVVSARRGGTKFELPVGSVAHFTDEAVTLVVEDTGKFKFSYKIHPHAQITKLGQTSYRFDLSIKIEGKQLISKGIFLIDGDRLRICNSKPGQPRPREFSARANELSQAILVLERLESEDGTPSE